MFNKFAEKNIAPDGAKSKGNWVKNQPEDDVFRRYFGPDFLFMCELDMYTISQILVDIHNRINNYYLVSSGTKVKRFATSGGIALGEPLIISTKTQSVSPRTSNCSSSMRIK